MSQIAGTGLELLILLGQPPEYWDPSQVSIIVPGSFGCFEMRFHCVACAGLELSVILLPCLRSPGIIDMSNWAKLSMLFL